MLSSVNCEREIVCLYVYNISSSIPKDKVHRNLRKGDLLHSTVKQNVNELSEARLVTYSDTLQ